MREDLRGAPAAREAPRRRGRRLPRAGPTRALVAEGHAVADGERRRSAGRPSRPLARTAGSAIRTSWGRCATRWTTSRCCSGCWAPRAATRGLAELHGPRLRRLIVDGRHDASAGGLRGARQRRPLGPRPGPRRSAPPLQRDPPSSTPGGRSGRPVTPGCPPPKPRAPLLRGPAGAARPAMSGRGRHRPRRLRRAFARRDAEALASVPRRRRARHRCAAPAGRPWTGATRATGCAAS